MADGVATVAAVDVGGTSIKAAAVVDGRLSPIVRTPTPSGNGPAVIEETFALIDSLVAVHGTCAAIGIVAPGLVDGGIVRRAANLGWQELDLAGVLADRYGVPVAVEHDVRAAALAEYHHGAGVGSPRLVFLGIGTGISAAILVDGRPLDGAAGEVGHGGSLEGDPCACGGFGCVETYASAAGIAHRYRLRTGVPASAIDVLEAAQGGDHAAAAIWDDAIHGVAGLLAGAVRLLGDVRVVIGGGLSLAGAALFDPLRQATAELLTVHPVPRIVASTLRDEGSLHGAALIGRRVLEESRSRADGRGPTQSGRPCDVESRPGDD
ncbi:MAG: hypothetical protein DI570_26340 [Phenylobacterium zucineum]|nr:MAG: hypothetical protein DI570_26340 [Phenylobacterium zucineum]